MISRDVVNGADLYRAFDKVRSDRKVRVSLINNVARDDDDVRVGFFDLFEQLGLLDAEELVMEIGYLDDGEFGAKAEISFVQSGDQVVVLVEADNADDYLDDHQDGNHEELGLQGLVVEEAHAQECADGAADPGPEQEGLFGHAALVLFRARLVVSVEDKCSEVN